MSETNDRVNIKRSNNHSDIENTQDEINNNNNDDSSQLSQSNSNKVNKRRIIVPIRRTRLNQTPKPTTTPASAPPTETTKSTQQLSDSSESNNSNRSTLSIEQKKKLFVKRRRITPKPLHALEPSIIQNESSSTSKASSSTSSSITPPHIVATPEISLEFVTRLSNVPRTYTYLVTRVHDNQSETISSSFVRDQIKTLTDTITHTVQNTAHIIQPTETKQIAHTSVN